MQQKNHKKKSISFILLVVLNLHYNYFGVHKVIVAIIVSPAFQGKNNCAHDKHIGLSSTVNRSKYQQLDLGQVLEVIRFFISS